jgi:multidrug efflux pump subunit AcrB
LAASCNAGAVPADWSVEQQRHWFFHHHSGSAPGSTIATADQATQQLTALLLKDPNVDMVQTDETVKGATLFVKLKPHSERQRDQVEFEQECDRCTTANSIDRVRANSRNFVVFYTIFTIIVF